MACLRACFAGLSIAGLCPDRPGPWANRPPQAAIRSCSVAGAPVHLAGRPVAMVRRLLFWLVLARLWACRSAAAGIRATQQPGAAINHASLGELGVERGDFRRGLRRGSTTTRRWMPASRSAPIPSGSMAPPRARSLNRPRPQAGLGWLAGTLLSARESRACQGRPSLASSG